MAALLLSYNQNLLSDDFGQILKRTARDVTIYGVGRDDTTGYGLVRADAAIAFVQPPRRVQQAQITPTGSPAFAGSMMFSGVPLLPDGTYSAIRWDLVGTYIFPIPYQSTPDTWFRTSGTIGVQSTTTAIDHRLDPPAHADILALTATSITLRTHVYQLFGAPIQWYPEEPTNARIALTAIGPVSPISVEDAPSASSARITPIHNPGHGHVTFALTLTDEHSIGVRIYDVTGRLVRRLSERRLSSGNHEIQWDGLTNGGTRARAGVYYLSFQIDGEAWRDERAVLLR